MYDIKILLREFHVGILFLINIVFINIYTFVSILLLKLIFVSVVMLGAYLYSVVYFENYIFIENVVVESITDSYNSKYRSFIEDFLIYPIFSYIYIIIFIRSAMRIAPLHIENNKLKTDVYIYRYILIMVVMYYLSMISVNSIYYEIDYIYNAGNFTVNTFMSIRNIIFSLLFIFLLLYFFIRRRKIEKIEYILYLRSFSGFSDRSAIIDIAKSLKNIYPLLFVIPINNKIRDWDPYIVSFIPFSFFNPYKNAPIYIATKTDSWKENINEMIKKSKYIILDISEITESIIYEMSLINENKKLSSTIFISKNSLEKIQEKHPKLFLKIKNENFIKYDKSLNFLKNTKIMYFTLLSFLVLMVFLLIIVVVTVKDIEAYKLYLIFIVMLVSILYVLVITSKRSTGNKFKKEIKNKIDMLCLNK